MAGWGAAAAAATEALTGMADNLWSAKQAKLARKHQEKMYKHRYQWGMDDARKAGLNPILIHGSNPAGSIGSSAMAQTHSMKINAANFAKLGDEKAKLKAEAIERTYKQALNEEQAHEARERTNVARETVGLIKEQSKQAQSTARKQNAEATVIESTIPSAKAVEEMDKTPVGKALRWLKRTRDAVTPFPKSGR